MEQFEIKIRVFEGKNIREKPEVHREGRSQDGMCVRFREKPVYTGEQRA